jgi:exopolyphosphatase/guanosine-5'-triphosphate,3'-diphosphate pyrophosphatase
MLRHIEEGAAWWAEVTRLADEATVPDPRTDPVPLRIAKQ